MKKSMNSKIPLVCGTLLVSTVAAVGIMTTAIAQEEVDRKLGNGDPWINSCLKENITDNLQIDPKDDLHLYANLDWLRENTIPDGYSSWSLYAQRGKAIIEECMQLLDEQEYNGHDAQLIHDYYNAIIDWDTRNTEGVSAFKAYADQIAGIQSIADLSRLYSDPDNALKYYCPFTVYASPGFDNTDYYKMEIVPHGLLLEDSANYSNMSEYAKIRYEYDKETVLYMFDRIGIDADTAEEYFKQAIALETELAPFIFTQEERFASDYYEKANNSIPYSEIIESASAFPFDAYIHAVFNKDYDGICIVGRPDYITFVNQIYQEDHLDLLKSRMLVSAALSCIETSDQAAAEKKAELDEKYLGIVGQLPIEEEACRKIMQELAVPMAKAYIERYSSLEDKEKLEETCQMVIDGYKELLSSNDWASEETINYAIQKLDSMTIHAAWPDKWDDYSALMFKSKSMDDIENEVNRFQYLLYGEMLGMEVDSENWAKDMPLLTCNAFYNPSDNSINMILGMMGEPFYYSDMPVEELYASLGAFWIGHEVSHAFDSNGAQFDIDGNLRNWWSEEDLEKFRERVKKMDDYLDSILIMDNYYTNGSNVDSEMIADMMGIQCALLMAEKVEDFDYQRFFEYYAHMNVSLNTYEKLLQNLENDPHPFNYQRTNVPCQQFEEFYKAYDVQEGDHMYLAPEDRIRIW